ncbi:hypothetical protein BWQ96_03176 [Gracilariopsis chorda]|uniref:Uncharacterized protein n=1 Tax=Gracilariopsis chorda TaxID=448386 RepID=A0A2V3IYB6_9FLOR|nr:hypothetical protein BWQ96_03176 [Gracilariopsis chorda]|eukprot:PXF47099.1 hypothetical protein BWQ96_03176 [Gracilariopsis chorda]
MSHCSKRITLLPLLVVVLLLLTFHTLPAQARLNQKTNHQVWRRLRQSRQQCAQSIQICDVPQTADDIENCVLRCMSSQCYNLVYSQHPLEEGEVDDARMRTFMKCAHTEELKQLKQRRSERWS